MIDTRRLNNKSEEMNKKPFFVMVAKRAKLFSWASKAPDLGSSDEIQDTLIKNYR